MGVLEFILCVLMILVTGAVAMLFIITNNINDDLINENDNLKKLVSDYEYKNNNLGGKE